MKHTIVAWVEDKPGVLNRITGLFRRRNFNIESLTVGHTEQPGISRMTFVADNAHGQIRQIRTQLDKLINVVRIEDVTNSPAVIHELAMIKVRTTPANRAEIIQLASIYRAIVVDVSLDSLIIEIADIQERVDALVKLLDYFGIVEMVRTGRIAMTRGIETN